MPLIETGLRTLLKQEQERLEAMQELQRIAQRYPGLFEAAAKAFLEHRNAQRASSSSGEVRSTPTKAIFDWLAEHKEGTPSQIVADLVACIETDAKKPANIIYSTLASLEKRGRLQVKKDAQGNRVYLIAEMKTSSP